MNAQVEQQKYLMSVPRAELLKLGAADGIFYSRTFFPNAFRQAGPDFDRDFWTKLDDPGYDFFAAEVFRGGAKTTRARSAISRRIAYGLTRNTLAVAISESMSIHTITWLKKQVENNTFWTSTFGLRKGKKWTEDWIEIINEPFDMVINVLAKGMTSGLRGLNLDDWRPDFIYADDVCNEENTATEEQRNKTNELIFGALVPSLAPKSEAPTRKFVLTNTGLHPDDAINRAHKDPTFLTVKYPKLVEKDGVRKSAWEARWTTEEVIREMEEYTARGQFYIWLREFGCKIISRETAPLDATRLKKYKTLPTVLKIATALDPATTSTSPQAAKKLHKTAAVTWGMDPRNGELFLLNYFSARNVDPDEMWVWLVAEYRRYRGMIGAETVAFQKFLKWYFEKKMAEDRIYFNILPINDKRSKPQRIIQGHSGHLAMQKMYIGEQHTEFEQQMSVWTEGIDIDLLDASAHAIGMLNPWMVQSDADADAIEGIIEDEKDVPDIEYEGGAP